MIHKFHLARKSISHIEPPDPIPVVPTPRSRKKQRKAAQAAEQEAEVPAAAQEAEAASEAGAAWTVHQIWKAGLEGGDTWQACLDASDAWLKSLIFKEIHICQKLQLRGEARARVEAAIAPLDLRDFVAASVNAG